MSCLFKTLIAVAMLTLVSRTGRCADDVSPVFLISDARLHAIESYERGINAPLHPEDRAIFEEIRQGDPVQAIRRLGYYMRFRHQHAAAEFALEQILKIQGWQDVLEALALEIKRSWDERPSLTQEPMDIRGQSGASADVFFIISQIARAGSNDAVLIVAPFLFDRTDLADGSPREPVPAEDAARVIASARLDAEGWVYQHTPRGVGGSPAYENTFNAAVKRWQDQRIGWCKWWVAHARKFGAEPPSSENALFEEVLAQTRAARQAHPNARLEPFVSQLERYKAANPDELSFGIRRSRTHSIEDWWNQMKRSPRRLAAFVVVLGAGAALVWAFRRRSGLRRSPAGPPTT